MTTDLPPPDARGLVWVPECGSTNDLARALFDRPDVRGVGADRQTAGRGRRGRAWHSPPGTGVYLTWIARPAFGAERGTVLPLMAAVAVAEVCAELGVRPLLNWPNDLLLAGRKLGGILCEARIEVGRGWVAAVGVGLNRATPPGGFPADVPGVALDHGVADPPPARALAHRLLDRLEAWLARLTTEGADPVLAAWETFGPARGTRLRRGPLEGTFAGLAPDGALRLDTPGGEVRIHAGDVHLIEEMPP